MGKMRSGYDPRNKTGVPRQLKSFVEASKEVMETHKITLETLAKNDIAQPIPEPKIVEIIRENIVVNQPIVTEKHIHHTRTIDQRARQHSIALRQETQKSQNKASKLLNAVQRVQSDRMSKIEKTVEECLKYSMSEKPKEIQLVRHEVVVEKPHKLLWVGLAMSLILNVIVLIIK